jgi:hypothetical protein
MNNQAPTVQEFIADDYNNLTQETIVVLFVEPTSAPYFLKPGMPLPTGWVNAYEIKSVHLA